MGQPAAEQRFEGRRDQGIRADQPVAGVGAAFDAGPLQRARGQAACGRDGRRRVIAERVAHLRIAAADADAVRRAGQGLAGVQRPHQCPEGLADGGDGPVVAQADHLDRRQFDQLDMRHACSGPCRRQALLPRMERARADAGEAAECPRERLRAVIADLERDRRHGLAGAGQAMRGPCEPRALHRGGKALPGEGAIDAMEMIGRQMRDGRQALHRVRGARVRQDRLDDACDPLGIAAFCAGFHGGASIACPPPARGAALAGFSPARAEQTQCARPGRLIQRRHALDLQQEVRVRQRRHGGGAGRVSAGLEVRGIEAVHLLEVLAPGQEHVHLDHAIPPYAGRLQDAGDVLHHLVHLRREVVDGELAVLVERGNARHEQQVADLDRRRQRHRDGVLPFGMDVLDGGLGTRALLRAGAALKQDQATAGHAGGNEMGTHCCSPGIGGAQGAAGRRGAARGGKRNRKRAPEDMERVSCRQRRLGNGRLAGFMLGRHADGAIGQIDEAGMARAGRRRFIA
ncbi:protein of unknown function (plasmid) [Ralstonia solanacearum PSI07]|nr:protein of unknown function [Ralstonia solanacearum PSI07]